MTPVLQSAAGEVMHSNHAIGSCKVLRHDRVTAELASVAYSLALERGVRGSWIGLELDLWKAVREVMEELANARHRVTFSRQFNATQQGLIAELAQRACSIAKRHGVEGPFSELELGMNRAFQSVIKPVGCRACAERWPTYSRYQVGFQGGGSGPKVSVRGAGCNSTVEFAHDSRASQTGRKPAE